MGNAHTSRPPSTRSGPDHVFGRPLVGCPACGSDQLEPVVEAHFEEVHFFCRSCGRCWRTELGYVHRVDPPNCAGCSERERCEAVYAADLAARSETKNERTPS